MDYERMGDVIAAGMVAAIRVGIYGILCLPLLFMFPESEFVLGVAAGMVASAAGRGVLDVWEAWRG